MLLIALVTMIALFVFPVGGIVLLITFTTCFVIAMWVMLMVSVGSKITQTDVVVGSQRTRHAISPATMANSH